MQKQFAQKCAHLALQTYLRGRKEASHINDSLDLFTLGQQIRAVHTFRPCQRTYTIQTTCRKALEVMNEQM